MNISNNLATFKLNVHVDRFDTARDAKKGARRG